MDAPKPQHHSPHGMLSGEYARGACVRRRVAQGLFWAMGAPLGWFLLRSLTQIPFNLSTELREAWGLYLYMFLGTSIVMAAFGFVVGKREQRLEELNARLRHLSFTDGLTELRNARYFWSRFEDALATSRRTSAPVSLILFDLDHFKRVNDEHGHAAGDRVLEGIGQALAQEVRAGEVAARVGGEEFALLMPDTSVLEAQRAAERIREALAARHFEGRDRDLVVTLSGGIASTQRGEAKDPQELFDRADVALYRAKHAGRNNIKIELPEERPREHAPGRSSVSSQNLDFAGQSTSGEWGI